MEGLDHDRALMTALVSYSGLTAAEVARRAGLAATTIQRPIKGTAETRISQRTLEKLRDAFPHFPGWTASLAETRLSYRAQDYSGPPRSVMDDSLEIPMLELAYGMGGAFLDDHDPDQLLERFPRAFVRMFTSSPADQLAFAHGVGDSMEPTISDRDLLLIDRSRDAIRINDQIWVVASGGIGMVKRVRVERGATRLLSDNPSVPDYEAAEDELTIIGRVVAIVKRI
jgi:phage repressor protein C with HTH and peptisase S24 domain